MFISIIENSYSMQNVIPKNVHFQTSCTFVAETYMNGIRSKGFASQKLQFNTNGRK